MTSNPTTVLRQAIRTVARDDQREVTDRELLRRFAMENDQAAFAALVSRHAGMVLGVCRRALPTVQDAEDAVQATFLVLARKAKSVRWRPSVANYLFGTARKVAGNARVAARRRRRREARVGVPEVVRPVDRMTGRELLAALDEELDKLPARYREPLVLCYLEGLTSEEAARRLGVPLATLYTRMDRGRKRLHDALTKGGLALGGGLLTLAVTSPAGASPPRLVQAVLATVSGPVPDAVAELAKGVAMNGVLTRSVLALAAVIGVVALGIGQASLKSPAGQPQDKPPAAATDKGQGKDKDGKPAGETGKQATFSGRVLDPEGKPVAGARLVLLGDRDEPANLGTSGTDGRFKVEVPAGRKTQFLIARVEGVGIDFIDLGKADPGKDIELRTVKDRPIRGRVVDTQGKAVAGAKVSVKSVYVYAGNSLDSFLTEWKKGHPYSQSGLPSGVKHLSREMGSFPVATTDADGRFTITGVGAERLAELRLYEAGIAEAMVWVVNRDGFDPKPYNQAEAEGWLLHGPDPAVVTEAEKRIRGVVKDIATGKPRAGVKVWLSRPGDGWLWPSLMTTTDAEGRYEIRGARKAESYMVRVNSDPAAGFMVCQVRAADTAGYEPIIADIPVKKGVIITGKLLDAATNKPLPGTAIITALSDNPYVKEYPELGSPIGFSHGEMAEDGTFRIVTIPGPVLLMGRLDGGKMPDGEWAGIRYKPPMGDPKYPQYFASVLGRLDAFVGPGGIILPLQGEFCKVLEIKPDAEIVQQDIVFEPATALPVKIQDADGRPLAGTWVTGVSALDWLGPMRVEKDSCSAYHLQPDQPRLMVFYEPTRMLFGTLALKGDEKDEAVVKLGPGGAVKGRLLDEQGRPLAGVTVSLTHAKRSAAEVYQYAHRDRNIETDADGKFQIDAVIPGVKFALAFKRGKGTFVPVTKPDDLTAKSGETLDGGNLKLKPQPGTNDE